MQSAFILLAVLVIPSFAYGQEAGWHYSPLPDEGDRASLGCASQSTPEDYACLAVRCEDDFSHALYVYASAPAIPGTSWRLTIDEIVYELSTEKGPGPYGLRISGDVTEIIDALKNGALAYIELSGVPEAAAHAIPLDGSFYAINEAFAFCAPRNPVVHQDDAPLPETAPSGPSAENS